MNFNNFAKSLYLFSKITLSISPTNLNFFFFLEFFGPLTSCFLIDFGLIFVLNISKIKKNISIRTSSLIFLFLQKDFSVSATKEKSVPKKKRGRPPKDKEGDNDEGQQEPEYSYEVKVDY